MTPLQLKPAVLGTIAGIAAAVVFAGGVKVGLWWNAGDLAECEATVSEIERASDALEKENERIRMASAQVTRDVSNSWAAALDHARANPRTVRVRQDCGGASGMPGLSATATGTQGLQVGRGEGGLSLSVGQCETLANDSLLDDQWIRLVKEWIAAQAALRP